MTDAITDSAGLSGPVSEAPKPRKRTAASTSTRATKKAAQKAPEVKNVEIVVQEESTKNKDGQEIITVAKKKRTSTRSNSFTKENGAIASGAADFSLENKDNTEKIVENSESDNIALWSAKNIRWGGVGSLSTGYNIVTKEAAEKWLTLGGIREATPQEVATYYGN